MIDCTSSRRIGLLPQCYVPEYYINALAGAVPCRDARGACNCHTQAIQHWRAGSLLMANEPSPTSPSWPSHGYFASMMAMPLLDEDGHSAA